MDIETADMIVNCVGPIVTGMGLVGAVGFMTCMQNPPKVCDLVEGGEGLRKQYEKRKNRCFFLSVSSLALAAVGVGAATVANNWHSSEEWKAYKQQKRIAKKQESLKQKQVLLQQMSPAEQQKQRELKEKKESLNKQEAELDAQLKGTTTMGAVIKVPYQMYVTGARHPYVSIVWNGVPQKA